jgi:heat shock protein HtpX
MAFWSNMGRRDSRDNNDMGALLMLVGIVGSIIAFLIGPLISAAVSRQREYLADATSAEITRYPEGLESALQKLGEYGRPMRRKSSAMAHMYIADPMKPGMVERLFSTHPPIPQRIERLKKIGSQF